MPPNAFSFPGLNLIGFLSGNLGIGVAARHLAALFEAEGIPIAIRDLNAGGGRSGQDPSFAASFRRGPEPLPYPVNVFLLNPPEIEDLLKEAPLWLDLGKSFNICIPYWELPRLPESWKAGLSRMQLVLAPSRLVQAALAAALPSLPVRYFPPPVRIPAGMKGDRARYGLPSQGFLFCTSFDLGSSLERKNPLGALLAFHRAFAGRSDIHLVVKMNNTQLGENEGALRQVFSRLTRSAPNIHFIEERLSYEEVLGLYASCDAFLSLHRAEGFGLALAESMLLGKPVIATGWSGNLDFMDDGNSILLPYRLVPIEDESLYGKYTGEEKQTWAAASEEAAIRAMEDLCADAPGFDRAKALGERARRDMEAWNAKAGQAGLLHAISAFFARHETGRGEFFAAPVADGPRTSLPEGGRSPVPDGRKDWAGVPDRIPGSRAVTPPGTEAEPLRVQGDDKTRPLRVLFQNRASVEKNPGGDGVVMFALRDELQKRGVRVDFSPDPDIDLASYDLVHAFNLILPELCEPWARNAKAQGKPFVLHAFQEDWPRFRGPSLVASRLFQEYLAKGQPQGLLPRLLTLLSTSPQAPPETSPFVLQNADRIFVCSEEEGRSIRALEPGARTAITPYGSRIDTAGAAESAGSGTGEAGRGGEPWPGDAGEAFKKAFGLDDFVLCVGRLEPRKNQLMLLAALERDDLPIVFADGGLCYCPEYKDLCHQFKRKGRVVYTGRLSAPMLVSAYRAARVHCLPSWYELPGLVTLEAARYGASVVASSWGGIREYLQGDAEYCRPDNYESIRYVVHKAWKKGRPAAGNPRGGLFTWEKTALSVLDQYRQVLAHPSPALEAKLQA